MDVSQITDYLFVGRRYVAEDPETVRNLDVRLLINMIAFRRPPGTLSGLPVAVLWLRTVDFPLLPIPVRLLERGVKAALPVIQDGHRVLVYCEGGRHRSVAMASAILIAMGHPAGEAMRLISQKRAVADPWAWHIRRQIEKFEAHWRAHHPLPEANVG